jgi:hypothetical protein
MALMLNGAYDEAYSSAVIQTAHNTENIGKKSFAAMWQTMPQADGSFLRVKRWHVRSAMRSPSVIKVRPVLFPDLEPR